MAETDRIIRTSDQIAPARPSLSLERRLAKALKGSEARKRRGETKTGKATRPVRKKRRRKRSEPFVRLTLELIKSKAYRDLPPSAAKMLVHFLSRPGEAFGIPLSDRQAYETTFSLTYSEASKLGCARATFLAVVEALVGHGFLDPVRRGGVYNGRKVSSVYRLSQRWMAFGTSGFRPVNYRRWAVTGGGETSPAVREHE
ncbi:MAG: hypothetical protein A4E60_01048 [Syntrophorhabdus sp. PtaB.Bin047]|nr:MAG: hypothetical protein A4E60_01048 [Syntrophorhabdus sp. PtaB.Bin047]